MITGPPPPNYVDVPYAAEVTAARLPDIAAITQQISLTCYPAAPVIMRCSIVCLHMHMQVLLLACALAAGRHTTACTAAHGVHLPCKHHVSSHLAQVCKAGSLRLPADIPHKAQDEERQSVHVWGIVVNQHRQGRQMTCTHTEL